MKTPRMSADARRRQIVEATLELLADTSLSKVSTRQVARRLGITQPAIFRHFRSREAILLAVVEHARIELGTLIERLLRAPASPLDRAAALAHGLLTFVEAHPGLPRLLFSDNALDEGPVRAALRLLVSMQHTFLAELLRAGQRAGAVTPELTAEDAATVLVGLIQGLVLAWQSEGRPAALAGRLTGPLAIWRRALEPHAGRADGEASGAPGEPPAPGRVTLTALDARPALANGVDPLGQILAALEDLAPGALLVVLASFRPSPLITLLRQRGHGVIDAAQPDGAWAITAVIDDAAPLLDLRDREPPEPLEAVLDAVSKLGPAETFSAWLPRAPRLLMPHLERQDLRPTVHALPDGTALLHVVRSP